MNRRHFVASLGLSAALKVLPRARGTSRKGEQDAGPGKEMASKLVWPRPNLVPVPSITAGVAAPVLSLNGTWKFALDPPGRFWSNKAKASGWDDIEVPGECTMQGFAIARDTEYPIKRSILIPADFGDRRVFLRFDGLYSYGRVWVNGHYVRDHRGGFTSWDCDVTPYVTPGQEAWITVGMTDESDDISWQSNYAKHYIGGILRDVRLFAVPPDHVTRFHVETELDSSFRDAILRVSLAMALNDGCGARIELRLKDPQGNLVPIHPASIGLTTESPEAVVSILINGPEKWDGEHPQLYILDAIVKRNGALTQTLTKRFGFRKVEVRGNRLYVNGDSVKLRGVCRHDIDPTRGRSTTPALDEQDVRMLKGANFNFVRTSHYPPTGSFLNFCDRYGVYVEEESAVCFVDEPFGSPVTAQNDEHYTAQFMTQFTEMIERDRDHPSVIIWSLGNESQWGTNFAKERLYASMEDSTRPVIFSFPDTVPGGVKAYDIFSKHYPEFDADFSSVSLPRLNDEYGHVSCYNQGTLRRDPGVRNYWGKSVKKFWRGMSAASGCLGGSIWAGIDEVFMLPSSCVGYGEWGVIDGWRREKPEYWLAKKAYSPVKLPDTHVENPGLGNPLKIHIGNGFNHTNLNEIRIEWRVGLDRGAIEHLNVPAHGSGWLVIPGRLWRNGETVSIKCIVRGARVLDEYELPIGRGMRVFPPVRGPAPRVLEDRQTLRVWGGDFEIIFSKASGLIRKATYRGHPVLEGGPVLNLVPLALRGWWLNSLKTMSTPEEIVIEISGNYQRVGNFRGQVLVHVQYQIRIDGSGLITTNFKIQDLPKDLAEIGVAYILPPDTDQLSWCRKSLWSVYPPDHIGRPAGVAQKMRSTGVDEYRVAPSWSWSQDMKDFFLFGLSDPGGRGTQDFRSQKENIWFASGIISRTGVRARIESEAAHAVRAEVQSQGQVRLNINSAWAYPELGWGNECRALRAADPYEGSVKVRLTDNDFIGVSFEDH